MKNKPALLVFLLVSLLSMLHAEDKPLHSYQGEIAGVVCSACSEHVKAALSKLEGVTSVKVLLGKEGQLPQLRIVSTSTTLTKEAAIKALGDKADHYQIQSLTLADR